MSINGALQAGVSGLKANSTALSGIANNIANSNTIGYKQTETSFQSLVTAPNAGASLQSGGVAAVSRQRVSEQGLQVQTGSGLDLSISGQGFFVVTDKVAGVTAADTRSFTRAGAFTVNDQGYLKNSAGLFLQGWPVGADGTIATDPSDLTKLQAINVSQVGGAADLTTQIGISANLKSSQPVSTAALAAAALPPGAGAYDAAANSMAMYGVDNTTGVKPDYSLQLPISDSQGGKRTVQINFLKSDTPNQWYAEIVAVPASEVTDGAGLSNGQIAVGVVAFTANGKLDPAATTLFAGGQAQITFGASNAAAPGAGQVNWATSLGIGAQTVSFNIGSATGGITQFDSPSATQAISTNGAAFGNLSKISIDDSGYVTAAFDNGVVRRIAQVAIATFANPDGLIAVSGDAFRVSQASGAFSLKSPGLGGAGKIAPHSLESSTVDLATQFTGLIVTQRAYSASSKVITTADQMIQELLSVIR